MIQRWELRLLHFAFLVLMVTGCAVALSKYIFESTDPFSVVGRPWEPTMLALHVVAAPLFIFTIGYVFRRHVVGKIRDRRADGRRSGMLLLALFVVLVASGYGLQVTTGELIRRTLSLSHIGVGLLFIAGWVGHARVKARPANGLTPLAIARHPGSPRPRALQTLLTPSKPAAHNPTRTK